MYVIVKLGDCMVNKGKEVSSFNKKKRVMKSGGGMTPLGRILSEHSRDEISGVFVDEHDGVIVRNLDYVD